MSGSVCSIEHQDLSIYSHDLIVIHIPFGYIFVHIYRHCIGLFILCTYVSHAT